MKDIKPVNISLSWSPKALCRRWELYNRPDAFHGRMAWRHLNQALVLLRLVLYIFVVLVAVVLELIRTAEKPGCLPQSSGWLGRQFPKLPTKCQAGC